MQRKDLQNISLADKEFSQRKPESEKETFKTPEEIEIKTSYSKEDISESEHLNFAAGIPPYLRGPYSTMYVSRPGLSASMQDFLLLKKVMLFIEGILLQDRKDFR